ncbi:MAG: hypothetical protein RLY20_2507 [Verrucomicrobiota bacterium]|jgi:2'-5' RNA ligase
MKHYGIFIEPTGSLAESIRVLKAEVERQLPGQKFCSHPPHSTLIYGQYQDPKLWRDQLAGALAALPPFRIQTTEFGFFYDDALAGGGHTVVFKAQPVPEIYALQKACGDILKRWRIATQPPRGGLLEREPFRSSFAEYGFPFVGPHWIPHFTVASLKVAKDAPLLRALTAGNPRHEFLLDRVSVWEIAGDSHAKLFEAPLRK